MIFKGICFNDSWVDLEAFVSGTKGDDAAGFLFMTINSGFKV